MHAVHEYPVLRVFFHNLLLFSLKGGEGIEMIQNELKNLFRGKMAIRYREKKKGSPYFIGIQK
jgi:hypothetical protein